MNSRRSFLTFDFIIILAILCLSVISVCFIYSSGLNSEGVNTSIEFIKQIIWIVTGLGLMTLVILIDYKYFYDFPTTFTASAFLCWSSRSFWAAR